MRLTGKSQQSATCLPGNICQIFLGNQAQHEVEVTLVETSSALKDADLRLIWRERSNNGDRKVVVANEFADKATLYGPSQDRQPITVKSSIAQRLLQSYLDAPEVFSAVHEVISFFDAHTTTELGGVKNKGLFATHHLRENLPSRRDLHAFTELGFKLAEKRHRGLIEALGFEVAKEERNALVLKTSAHETRAIALVLEDSEPFDARSGRFPSSPVSLGLSMAAEYNVPWLILVRKDQIRLHPCKDGVGVGQKGQAETFLELNLSLLDEDNVGLLPLVFSADSLSAGGEVDKLLTDSAKFAANLGTHLRERVYEQVVPPISIAVAKKLQERGQELTSQTLQAAYSMTLKILFRLLFQAYAEDRGLLPAGRNEGFDANSLKELGKRHIDTPLSAFGQSSSIWYDLVQVWDSIDVGNDAWQIPAYNGGLFGSDPAHHPEGAAIKQLQLPDSVLGPALQALLIDATDDGVRGPVDFRSLSVREFGTIYEGLLESSLSVAEVDLTVDSSNAWVPANAGDPVLAKAGDPYFHSASGERKATGSYFTPKFVVDHLVQKAIDPTIDAHLEKIAGYLRAGDTATAGRDFFDFRVADLAMGSAHFLVAAVDRIEAKMRAFLAQPENTVPAVVDELARLRKAAVAALKGDDIAISEIEDFSLLRRQIARRCIYGIDINYMAVELARLAIWIHTFVPGLPMSTLDHNLVHGNSLTGIGSIDEALDALVPGRNNQPTLFDDQLIASLEVAKNLLIDAAVASEADKREVEEARELASKAAASTQDVRRVFDAAIAARLGVINPHAYFDIHSLAEVGDSDSVQALASSLRPAHLPYLFPEVFLRENGGFDALVGNPPWEKMQLDSARWWNLRSPGLMGMAQAARDAQIKVLESTYPVLKSQFDRDASAIGATRDAILKGPYAGLGKSIPDLYQAFVWRNWHLLNALGTMSLVLPRGALRGSALEQWRREVLDVGCFREVVVTVNTGGWLFPTVHPQYGIALLTVDKRFSRQISLKGPIRSIEEFKNEKNGFSLNASDFMDWSASASFPAISNPKDFVILGVMAKSPKLESSTSFWKVRATQGDMNQTSDKNRFDVTFNLSSETLPVMTGGSFNLWNPDYAKPFAVADKQSITEYLVSKIQKGVSNKRSPYFDFPVSERGMPFNRPRIAYRWITNQTNSRTSVVCLVPPETPLVNSAPVLIFHAGGAPMEALALGVMSSIPYDWSIRRWVEMNFTFEVLYPSRIPYDKAKTRVGQRMISLAAMLASVDDRYSIWAAEVGVPVGSVKTEDQKNEYIYEIDALVSLMYGLTEDQVVHIFETFHRGWDYKPRLARVLDYYREWKEKTDA